MMSILMLVVGITLVLLLLFNHVLIRSGPGVASGPSCLAFVTIEDIAQCIGEGDGNTVRSCRSNCCSISFDGEGFFCLGDDGISIFSLKIEKFTNSLVFMVPL